MLTNFFDIVAEVSYKEKHWHNFKSKSAEITYYKHKQM